MKHQRIKKRPRSEELEPEYELLNGYRMVKPVRHSILDITILRKEILKP